VDGPVHEGSTGTTADDPAARSAVILSGAAGVSTSLATRAGALETALRAVPPRRLAAAGMRSSAAPRNVKPPSSRRLHASRCTVALPARGSASPPTLPHCQIPFIRAETSRFTVARRIV
jgi:hypothetical protein